MHHGGANIRDLPKRARFDQFPYALVIGKAALKITRLVDHSGIPDLLCKHCGLFGIQAERLVVKDVLARLDCRRNELHVQIRLGNDDH